MIRLGARSRLPCCTQNAYNRTLNAYISARRGRHGSLRQVDARHSRAAVRPAGPAFLRAGDCAGGRDAAELAAARPGRPRGRWDHRAARGRPPGLLPGERQFARLLRAEGHRHQDIRRRGLRARDAAASPEEYPHRLHIRVRGKGNRGPRQRCGPVRRKRCRAVQACDRPGEDQRRAGSPRVPHHLFGGRIRRAFQPAQSFRYPGAARAGHLADRQQGNRGCPPAAPISKTSRA